MKSKGMQTGTLFFSMTLEFLETYLPRQLGRSPKTIKSYRDSLTVFRRYLYEECHISVGTFKFALYMGEASDHRDPGIQTMVNFVPISIMPISA